MNFIRRIFFASRQAPFRQRNHLLGRRANHSRFGLSRNDLFMAKQIRNHILAEGNAVPHITVQSTAVYSMSHDSSSNSVITSPRHHTINFTLHHLKSP
jgi:hypothetical protein